ncbi:MAG: hypothetical protein OZ926_00140 [Pseudomonas sp.]|uniref:hypothetical protein n=1 Tax=Stutzerimonas degradans TaxID=2968968 RepID=UPI0015E128EA|nr:hypothetical protein [Stutzerimonas degradans]MCQ4273758.1 hypothetical protein [Stutzerimonas degradans]MEB2325243.1 hypothetical protein [Pseudomonas sp.]QPT20905.1 hypothetical protein I6G33_14685 [Stutzerimonas degradans]
MQFTQEYSRRVLRRDAALRSRRPRECFAVAGEVGWSIGGVPADLLRAAEIAAREQAGEVAP